MAVQKLSQIVFYLFLFYSASIGKAKPINSGHFSVRRSQALDPLVPFLSRFLCAGQEVLSVGLLLRALNFYIDNIKSDLI